MEHKPLGQYGLKTLFSLFLSRLLLFPPFPFVFFFPDLPFFPCFLVAIAEPLFSFLFFASTIQLSTMTIRRRTKNRFMFARSTKLKGL